MTNEIAENVIKESNWMGKEKPMTLRHMRDEIDRLGAERGLKTEDLSGFLSFDEGRLYPEAKILGKAGLMITALGTVGILARAGLDTEPEWVAKHLNIPMDVRLHNFLNSLWGNLNNNVSEPNWILHVGEAMRSTFGLGVTLGISGAVGSLNEKIKHGLDFGGRSRRVQNFLQSVSGLIEFGKKIKAGDAEVVWKLPLGSTIHIAFDGDFGANEMFLSDPNRNILIQANKPDVATFDHPWWAYFDHTDTKNVQANLKAALEVPQIDKGEVIIHPTNANDMIFSGNNGLDVSVGDVKRVHDVVKKATKKPTRVVVSKFVTIPRTEFKYTGQEASINSHDIPITELIPQDDLIDLSEKVTDRVTQFARRNGQAKIQFREDGGSQYTTEFNRYLKDSGYSSTGDNFIEVIYEKADVDAMNRIIDDTGELILQPNQILVFQSSESAQIIREKLEVKIKNESSSNYSLDLDQIIVGAEILQTELQNFASKQ